jgi:hypothetical protein
MTNTGLLVVMRSGLDDLFPPMGCASGNLICPKTHVFGGTEW